MIFPPTSVTDKWPTPNYVNPEVVGHYMVPVLIVLVVITPAIVLLRVYSRLFILRSFSYDDWIIIPATLVALILSITGILTAPYGWGNHVWDVPLEKILVARWYSIIQQFCFTITVTLTKLSILFFYLRFCITRTFRWLTYASMGFVSLWLVAWLIMIPFQCIPFKAYWNMPQPGDRCFSDHKIDELHIIHGTTNLFSDVLIWALPIPTIIRLMLPKRAKISLFALFSLGLVAPITACLRIVYIHRATATWDISWYGYQLWAVSSLECHIGIVCASIPSLKPLFIKAFPSQISQSAGSRTAFSEHELSLREVPSNKAGFVQRHTYGEDVESLTRPAQIKSKALTVTVNQDDWSD